MERTRSKTAGLTANTLSMAIGVSYKTYSGSLLSGVPRTFTTSFVYLMKVRLKIYLLKVFTKFYLDNAAVRVLTSSECLPATRLECLGDDVTKSSHPERLDVVGARDPVNR